MNEWYAQAKSKLEAGRKVGNYDKYARVMKNRISEKLTICCKQDGEFAQAVVQGGTFEDCMKTVAVAAKNYGGGGIPDEDALRCAVQFYFPGADVRFQMSVNLCASVETDEPDPEPTSAPVLEASPKILSLEDFL